MYNLCTLYQNDRIISLLLLGLIQRFTYLPPILHWWISWTHWIYCVVNAAEILHLEYTLQVVGQIQHVSIFVSLGCSILESFDFQTLTINFILKNTYIVWIECKVSAQIVDLKSHKKIIAKALRARYFSLKNSQATSARWYPEPWPRVCGYFLLNLWT